MKIYVDLRSLSKSRNAVTFHFSRENVSGLTVISQVLDSDQIEDLELNLTNIIKQLQDYRLQHKNDEEE